MDSLVVRALVTNMHGRLGQILAKALRIKRRRRSTHTKKRTLTLRRILAQNTDEFCKSTTLHGLKYITSEELYPTERVFFAISFVAVVVISSFFILKVYSKWTTTPVIFGINPEPTFIIHEPFPAVTICNLNQALKTKALVFSNYSKEHAMIQLLCKREVNTTVADTITDWSKLERFIINISQPCDRMIVGCRFGARDYNCSDLFYPIVTDEGLCCVFNMVDPSYMYVDHIPVSLRNITPTAFKPVDWYAEQGYPKKLPENFYPRTTPGTGESLGLSVTLDVEYNEYYCSSSSSVGFKISLHSPNESPNVRETGVLIAPGMETKVRIRPEKTESDFHLRTIRTKYRHCLFHDEGKLRYFAHYTQRNCEMECMAEMLIKYCGCISFYMPKIHRNATICSTRETPCVETVRLRIDPTIESCLDDCLPSCYDLTFLADVFAAQISHDGFEIVNQKVEQFSHRYVEQSIAVVNMYFKEYSFRSNIQTEFIGVSDFLSSIGGLMGLFLGFSFISIAELFYFAIIRPCRTFFKQRKSKILAAATPNRRHPSIPLKLQPNQLSAMRQYLKNRFNDCEQLHGIYSNPRKMSNREAKFNHSYMNNALLRSISESLDRNIDTSTS